MGKKEFLIIVDERDHQVGKLEKLEVHRLGLLHRAFSLFIFNSKGELLLQQRAVGKYHSAGLWTNSCCGHPHFGEDIANAATRRLKEELGMYCQIKFTFSFIYKTKFENGLTEHEFDHVFFGVTDDIPEPEKTEVQNWKYIDLANLENDLLINPHLYTSWLQVCFNKVVLHFEKNILSEQTTTS